MVEFKEILTGVLARLLNGLEHHTIHQKAVGSIPCCGTYGKQLIDASLSNQCFLH